MYLKRSKMQARSYTAQSQRSMCRFPDDLGRWWMFRFKMRNFAFKLMNSWFKVTDFWAAWVDSVVILPSIPQISIEECKKHHELCPWFPRVFGWTFRKLYAPRFYNQENAMIAAGVPVHTRRAQVMNILLKMKHFALYMQTFALKMQNFALKIMDFGAASAVSCHAHDVTANCYWNGRFLKFIKYSFKYLFLKICI